MLNKILIAFAILLFATGLRADQLTLNPDRPDSYTVVKGDTLWDISGRFLEQPWRWPEIWDINPQIENPHLIYPGDIISLSYRDGQPRLNLKRGMAARGASGRYVKLSPKIRSSSNLGAIPPIPVDAIQQFLKQPLVFRDNEIEGWPYIVSSYDQHLITTTGNKIYVRGIPEDTSVSRYSIYRKGPAYVRPRKNPSDKAEILGYEAIYVGDARLTASGDPASAVITGVDREVLNGDRLLPHSDEGVSTDFIPRPTDTEVEGNIISVIDGISQISQYQVVVLSLGAEQGIEPGNVLGVYQSGYVVQDRIGPNLTQSESQKQAARAESLQNATSAIGQTATKIGHAMQDLVHKFDQTFPSIANKQARSEPVTLPEEYVGVVMVFRTFDKISYALVMETRGPMHVLDTVRGI